MISVLGRTRTGEPKLTDFRGDSAIDAVSSDSGVVSDCIDSFSVCDCGGSFAAIRILTGEGTRCATSETLD